MFCTPRSPATARGSRSATCTRWGWTAHIRSRVEYASAVFPEVEAKVESRLEGLQVRALIAFVVAAASRRGTRYSGEALRELFG